MGYHTWFDYCPFCDFQKMFVSNYNDNLEVRCGACGYKKWTEIKEPISEDIELAKKHLSKMSVEELEEQARIYEETGKSLITRLKEGKNQI